MFRLILSQSRRGSADEQTQPSASRRTNEWIQTTSNHSIGRIIRIIHTPHLFLPITLNLSLFSIKLIILTIDVYRGLVSFIITSSTNSIAGKRSTSSNNTSKDKRSNTLVIRGEKTLPYF